MKLFIALFGLFAIVLSRDVRRADWKVVGGNPGAPGQFPYVVSLRGPTNNHNCGGSIVGTSWIMTAAHCVVGTDPKSINIVAGSHLLSSGGQSYAVEAIFLNDYQSIWFQNDISLLKIVQEIQLSSLVGIITYGVDHTDRHLDVVLPGWGTTSYGGEIPDHIQFVDMVTATHEECYSYWTDLVSISNICTLPRRGFGACHGDSGGPLVDVQRGVQLGIVSWGAPCAEDMPDVYTRVSSFHTWISEVIA